MKIIKVFQEVLGQERFVGPVEFETRSSNRVAHEPVILPAVFHQDRPPPVVGRGLLLGNELGEILCHVLELLFRRTGRIHAPGGYAR